MTLFSDPLSKITFRKFYADRKERAVCISTGDACFLEGCGCMYALLFGFIAVILLFVFATRRSGVPEIMKNTKGADKWKTGTDYRKKENWLVAEDTGKAVDVIYFYPTTFRKASKDAPDIGDIDDAGMRAGAQAVFANHATVFKEDCNLYAPFYRQVSAEYALTLQERDGDALFHYCASQDPAKALDYYFSHDNHGKPFILAGHSQGARILLMLLSDYMKKHPAYRKRMIAAYVIGYSVTARYLEANPHLKFAQGAEDVGVIVSYNTEGPGNQNAANAVVTQGAISINPINWKRDETYAAACENEGSLIGGNRTTNFADARVDLKRGVVLCTSVDPAVYAMAAPADRLFGPESYHSRDYDFYCWNLRENVKQRIAAYDQYAEKGSV